MSRRLAHLEDDRLDRAAYLDELRNIADRVDVEAITRPDLLWASALRVMIQRLEVL